MNIDLYDHLKLQPELWRTFLGDRSRIVTASKDIDKEVMHPDVSEYLFRHGLRARYPDHKKFALCLTHDVDDIYPPVSHQVLSGLLCLKKCDWSGLAEHLFWSAKRPQDSPYINFRKIMELEKKYGAKSTFNFMATSRDPRRFRYNIEDLAGEIRFIVDSGWEVGLHGGYYSYNDINAIRREKSRLENALGREVIGYRNHYLRFQSPETWEILEKCGFQYDSTYGYTDRIGFRNGMCHPYRPYNLQRRQWMNIYELPLHVMDSAMYDFAKPDQAWELIRHLLEQTERNEGILTILWHNNTFSCPFREKWGELYEKILQYGKERSAWMTSGEEIWKWWIENGC